MRASLTDGRSRWAAVALASLAAVGLLALTHARSAGATVQALAGTQISWTIALLALAVAGPILTSVLLCSGQATVGARYGRWEAIRLAAGIHAANLAVRLAGVAGLGVLLADERGGAVGRVPRSAAYVLGREVERIAFVGLLLTALVLRARRRIAAWAIAVDTLRLGWLWVALHAVGAYASVDVTVEAYGVVAPLGPPLRSPCPDRASSS